MLIGVPKEIKVHEYRVGMTPAAVREAAAHGHRVLLQAGAGLGIGSADADYRAAGAEVVDGAEEVFARAEMIVKVKEPQPAECAMLREGQVLFAYLHLAPDPEQARLLLRSGCTAIAYETVTAPGGGLPLLAPMSEVAGRMSIQAGAHALEKAQGGSGVLLGGGVEVPLNDSWAIDSNVTWAPGKQSLQQPHTLFVGSGFVYQMRRLPQDRVDRNRNGGYEFPRNLVHTTCTTGTPITSRCSRISRLPDEPARSSCWPTATGSSTRSTGPLASCWSGSPTPRRNGRERWVRTGPSC